MNNNLGKANAENSRDYDLKKAVYAGEYYQYFNVNEFDYKVHSYEYITSDLFRSATAIIVDMVKIGQMKVDFGDDELNQKIDEWRSEKSTYTRLEKMVEMCKVYGPSYIQLSQEDDNVAIYNISPNITHAEYNPENPQQDPSAYYTLVSKEINSKQYTLKTTYTKGFVTYTAYTDYGTENEAQIDPVEIFDIPEQAKKDDEMMYVIETGLEYNIMEGIQYNVKDDEFYGQGDLTMPILSKLNYYNRLLNLCDVIFTYNAFPKFQGSDEVVKLIDQAKAETQAKGTEELVTPASFMNEAPRVSAFMSSASYAFTRAFKLMRDKLYIFPAGRGGENKYIINEYNMNYLFDERDRIKQELLDELYISKMFYDTQMTTGQMSEVAMRRLMQKTINHVEDLHNLLESPLRRLFHNVASILHGYSGPLPTITWEGVSLSDFATHVDALAKADKIGNTYIKTKALSGLLHMTDEEIADKLVDQSLTIQEPALDNA